MAYENYTLGQLEAEMKRLEAESHEVGAKFDSAKDGEFIIFGYEPDEFDDAKSYYGEQIFEIYAEMGYIMNLIEQKRALIHAH